MWVEGGGREALPPSENNDIGTLKPTKNIRYTFQFLIIDAGTFVILKKKINDVIFFSIDTAL